MQITENEKEILAEMERYLKEQNRLYSKEYRLAEKFLYAVLPLLATLGNDQPLLVGYIETLRRQNRLLQVSDTYFAGKHCGAGQRPCDMGFLRFLCAVYTTPEAEQIDAELWKRYRVISQQSKRCDLLDEVTDLYRDMQSRSDELALEVFEAGYIAGLKERDEQQVKKQKTEPER